MTKKYRGGKRPASASRARRDVETRKVKRVKKSHRKNSNISVRGRVGAKYRTITVVVFAMLSFYLLGYIFVFVNKPSVATETVNYGTIDNPQTLSGLIIRDEYVVKSTMAGQPEFNYSENNKVPKDAAVCYVKDTGVSQNIEEEIKKIDKDILSAQATRIDISKYKEDIDKIQSSISNFVDNTAYKFSNGNVGDMYSLKNSVQKQITSRNEILISETTSSTAQLTEQRNEYATQLSGSVSSYTANESGILSFMIDNLEEINTPDTMMSITKEQINMDVQPEYISKSVSVSEGDPLFKIVRSNVWYIVSYVPNEMAAMWEVGDTVSIYTTNDDEEISADMTIESMDMGESETYVVFRSDENMIDFLPIRTMTFNVRQEALTGLKIPNSAIIEKTFLKIPLSCVIDNLGEKTVILKDGSSSGRTVNIDILRSDDEFVYVLQDFNTLKLGDTIVQGTGETASEYTINEVQTYKCVYVANSSIADYAIVDIIGENSDYSIVDPNSSYGLKIYDKIVSDAKTVENNQTLS